MGEGAREGGREEKGWGHRAREGADGGRELGEGLGTSRSSSSSSSSAAATAAACATSNAAPPPSVPVPPLLPSSFVCAADRSRDASAVPLASSAPCFSRLAA